MNTIVRILDRWTAFMWRLFGQPDVSQQVGQGRDPERKDEGPAFISWSPVVNVLLIVGLFAAVKLKLVFAAVVLAGLVGFSAWRAWA